MSDMKKVLETFNKRGIEASWFETPQEAVDYLAQKIQNKSVALGGSITLKEIGLCEALEKQQCPVVWHWKFPNTRPTYDLARHAEVYVTSANGVSATGQIINIDGTGNRVSATAFGPKEVYFVVGKNKLADDLEKALWRAKNIASPLNAKRLNRKTPCAVKGDKCYNCTSPERICRVTSIIDYKPGSIGKMELIIINADLGY